MSVTLGSDSEWSSDGDDSAGSLVDFVVDDVVPLHKCKLVLCASDDDSSDPDYVPSTSDDSSCGEGDDDASEVED